MVRLFNWTLEMYTSGAMVYVRSVRMFVAAPAYPKPAD